MSLLRAARISLVAAATLIVTAGCTHQQASIPEPDCTAPAFTAPYEHVDPCSGEAVLTAAATTIFTYHPAVEADQRSAFTAAAALLDPQFSVRAQPAARVFTPITAATWMQWRIHAVTVTADVRVTGDDHPTDTATAISRVLAVELRPSDMSPAVGFAVYAAASHASNAVPWRLAAMAVIG